MLLLRWMIASLIVVGVAAGTSACGRVMADEGHDAGADDAGPSSSSCSFDDPTSTFDACTFGE